MNGMQRLYQTAVWELGPWQQAAMAISGSMDGRHGMSAIVPSAQFVQRLPRNAEQGPEQGQDPFCDEYLIRLSSREAAAAAAKAVARTAHHAAADIRRAVAPVLSPAAISEKVMAATLIKRSIAVPDAQRDRNRLATNPRPKASNRLIIGCSST
jgi:hypothetical protein